MEEDVKKVVKFLVQCHRLAPPVTSIQAAMMLEIYSADEPYTHQELANELGLTVSQIKRNCEKMSTNPKRQDKLRRSDGSSNWVDYDRRLLELKNGRRMYLTDRGKSFCRSLLTNGRNYFRS